MINKVIAGFNQLKNIWVSNDLSFGIKLKIFNNTNVQLVLICVSETK